MIIERPYTIDPYDAISDKHYNWLDSYNKLISSAIVDATNTIKKEAELEGNPYLSDEAFLYECFKDNCEYNLVKDNWQVLKFFNANMRVKIFKDMIGQWTFTQEDKEMYNHFYRMKITKENKCTSPKLHFKSNKLPELHWDYIHICGEYKSMSDCMIYDITSDPISFPLLYQQEFQSLYSMIRNVKGLPIHYCDYYYKRPLFEYKPIHIVGGASEYTDFATYFYYKKITIFTKE